MRPFCSKLIKVKVSIDKHYGYAFVYAIYLVLIIITVAFDSSAQPKAQNAGVGTVHNIPNLLRIKLINQAGLMDETVVCLRDGATNLFDSNFDAYKLPGSAILIFSRLPDGTQLSVNCLAPWGLHEPTVPLSVYGNGPGPYKLQFSELETFYPEIRVLIKDNLFNQIIPIKVDTTIDFVMSAEPETWGDDRFELLFAEAIITGLSESSITYPQLLVWYNTYTHTLNIQLIQWLAQEPVSISVYDIAGRSIYGSPQTQPDCNGLIMWPVKLSDGLYQVSASTPTTKATTRLLVKGL